MGNKTNPIGMRLQVNRTWDSRWYADTKDYGDLLLEDLKIRDFIHEECKQAEGDQEDHECGPRHPGLWVHRVGGCPVRGGNEE